MLEFLMMINHSVANENGKFEAITSNIYIKLNIRKCLAKQLKTYNVKHKSAPIACWVFEMATYHSEITCSLSFSK